ncbi:primosomal replication protein [Vibrio makurazakiensis]|uniref:primosomal replication protein n=1 Tax=Vibrio makurazakiensis TaxID=2910250 RepID=UPI003D14BDE9
MFKCRSKKLLPCALEAKKTYSTIINEQQTAKLTPARAQHLSERLANQIEALQRELVTKDLRLDNQDHRHLEGKSLNTLYNDLAQHQDWSHRLKQLVTSKKQVLSDAPPALKPQAEQALDIAQQRLSRCQDAMQHIEKLINLENPKRNHD